MPASPSPSAPPNPRDAEALDYWLEARAQRLARRIARALSRIVSQVFGQFIESIEDTALTAAGDLSIIDDIIPLWRLVIPEIVPDIEETYLEGGISAFTVAEGYAVIPEAVAQAWTQVINTQAIDYMTRASNRMLDVGQTIWTDVSRTATRAIEQGLSRDKLAAQLREVSDRFAGYRADVIARTEVNAAYINGDFDGDLALGEYGPVEKVWVASMQSRTSPRPDHVDANNQVRAFAEPFSVGGVQMMIPHAAGAPASQVVNCRCHYEALYVGDRRPNGTIVGQDDVVVVDPSAGQSDILRLSE